MNKNDVIKLNTGKNNSRKYKIKTIWDSFIYTKEWKSDHLSEVYYLIFLKNYLKEVNTWELILAI